MATVYMAQKNSQKYLIGSPEPSGSLDRQVKKRGMGYQLPSQAKYIVESVQKFFEHERLHSKAVMHNRVVDRTAKACGIGTATVKRIHQEFADFSGTLESPEKRYDEIRTRIMVDEFDVTAICKEVHAFYERKEYPTLSSLLEQLKAEDLFKGCCTTLWKVLHEIGFCHKKHENKRYIYEQLRIIQQRHDYLHRLQRNCTEDHPVVYLDETWVNAHHGRDTMWVDTDGEAGWKHPSGKGGKLIVLHAGTAKGWIDGAELVFRTKSSTGDYHNEMNIDHLWSSGKPSSCPIFLITPSSLWIMQVTTMVWLKRCQPRAQERLTCKVGYRDMESVMIPMI